MPTITVRNITEELYALLKQAAKQNHRSISDEVIAILEASFRNRKIFPKLAIPRAGWREKFREMAKAGDDKLLDAPTPTHFDEEE